MFFIDEYWLLRQKKTPIPEIIQKTCPKSTISDYMEERLWIIESPEFLKYDKVMKDAVNVLNLLNREYRLVLVTLRRYPENLYWELEHFKLNYYVYP